VSGVGEGPHDIKHAYFAGNVQEEAGVRSMRATLPCKSRTIYSRLQKACERDATHASSLLGAMDLRKNFATFVRNTYVPNVVTISTEAAEKLCHKNALLFADMLQCVRLAASLSAC
jgi:hypothetical protein